MQRLLNERLGQDLLNIVSIMNSSAKNDEIILKTCHENQLNLHIPIVTY